MMARSANKTKTLVRKVNYWCSFSQGHFVTSIKVVQRRSEAPTEHRNPLQITRYTSEIAIYVCRARRKTSRGKIPRYRHFPSVHRTTRITSSHLESESSMSFASSAVLLLCSAALKARRSTTVAYDELISPTGSAEEILQPPFLPIKLYTEWTGEGCNREPQQHCDYAVFKNLTGRKKSLRCETSSFAWT
jgi:hypothetical protein